MIFFCFVLFTGQNCIVPSLEETRSLEPPNARDSNPVGARMWSSSRLCFVVHCTAPGVRRLQTVLKWTMDYVVSFILPNFVHFVHAMWFRLFLNTLCIFAPRCGTGSLKGEMMFLHYLVFLSLIFSKVTFGPWFHVQRMQDEGMDIFLNSILYISQVTKDSDSARREQLNGTKTNVWCMVLLKVREATELATVNKYMYHLTHTADDHGILSVTWSWCAFDKTAFFLQRLPTEPLQDPSGYGG